VLVRRDEARLGGRRAEVRQRVGGEIAVGDGALGVRVAPAGGGAALRARLIERSPWMLASM
jgi:hypothetical protein